MKKAGIPAKDFKRIINPFDATFQFTSVNKDVNIEKTFDVLPLNIYAKFLRLDPVHFFKAKQCHMNAIKACRFLKDYGIRVVDGYYIEKGTEEKVAHSFLEYNGHYFDPTIEFAETPFTLSDFNYHACKLFNIHERIIICHALAYLYLGDPQYCHYSPLSSDEEVLECVLRRGPNSIYSLNEDGKLLLAILVTTNQCSQAA